MFRVQLTRDLSEQFIVDVLTTAAEGGINYWAQFAVSRGPDGDVPALYDLVDAEDDTPVAHCIGLNSVCSGLQLAVAYVNDRGEQPYWKRSLLEAIADGDSGCIDAELADVIVKLAAFGEIVYG